MSYRSADVAIQERIDDVLREVVALDHRLASVRAELGEVGRARRLVDTRLAVEGPGRGGRRGAAILRIPFILGTLLFFAVLVLPGELHIAQFVRQEPRETIPPLLLVGGPALLATAISWRYRGLYPLYRVALVVSASLLVLLGVFVVCGYVGVFT